jgi:hypothetical protein
MLIKFKYLKKRNRGTRIRKEEEERRRGEKNRPLERAA